MINLFLNWIVSDTALLIAHVAYELHTKQRKHANTFELHKLRARDVQLGCVIYSCSGRHEIRKDRNSAFAALVRQSS